MSPRRSTVAELCAADLGSVRVWASPSAVERVRARVPAAWTFGAVGEPLGCDTLVAVGGGTLIDEAKAACRGERRVRLAAAASLWGSGAEASPVVVLWRGEKKVIRVDPALLPDIVVAWPELGATVDAARARRACGDVFAHALEALLSPLAQPDLRREIAAIVGEMLDLPLAYAPEWFDLSARAAAAQARCSVGLVHGIAHTLEVAEGAPAVGHAGLCATFLAPVLDWDRGGTQWEPILAAVGLREEPILRAAARLHEPDTYRALLPFLERTWRSVLRDPCTRTNGAAVRPDTLAHFQSWSPPSGAIPSAPHERAPGAP